MGESTTPRRGFGIDIGGSGIKAAEVDLDTGTVRGGRERIATPTPAAPPAVVEVVARLVETHEWPGPLGIAFPGVVRSGRIATAANLDRSWIGVQADELFSEATGTEVVVQNDADAAGVAEVRLGAAKGRSGVVIVLTFGTGIGSAIVMDGVLLPNTELGHLELDGVVAEHRAAARIRKKEDLDWREWAARVARFLRHLEWLFSPDLFVIGGGISRQPARWLRHLDVSTETVPASLANTAGIVGAALAVTVSRE